MKKIYKSALVVAAMIFASASFAQTVPSFKGIQNVSYNGTVVKFTTDFPKAYYEVIVDGAVVGYKKTDFTIKADANNVEIAATIAAGKSYTVKAVKKAVDGKIESANGFIAAGVQATYTDMKQLPENVSVYFDGTQIVVAGAQSVENLVAVSANGKETYFASGSSVSVDTNGAYIVSAIINGNPYSVKIAVVK